MKSLEQQLDDERKVNQAIVDLLDVALRKVGYSEKVINGLTVSGKIDFLVRAAQHKVRRTASPVKAKVVCQNGHKRVVEGKDFEEYCPECGAGIYEYDSRFGGE